MNSHFKNSQQLILSRGTAEESARFSPERLPPTADGKADKHSVCVIGNEIKFEVIFRVCVCVSKRMSNI